MQQPCCGELLGGCQHEVLMPHLDGVDVFRCTCALAQEVLAGGDTDKGRACNGCRDVRPGPRRYARSHSKLLTSHRPRIVCHCSHFAVSLAISTGTLMPCWPAHTCHAILTPDKHSGNCWHPGRGGKWPAKRKVRLIAEVLHRCVVGAAAAALQPGSHCNILLHPDVPY